MIGVLCLLGAGLLLTEPSLGNDQSERPLFLVHYMPWYQTPEVSGYWGWHWTMNHFNPDNRNESGQREIASHYYPVTGPYDSRDDCILEYQVLLMKISGIDGVIVDWYGIDDFRDYAILHQATRALFSYADLAELQYAICYEDQTVGHMVDEGYIDESDAVDQGRRVMQYLDENWFHSGEYVLLDDRPVLLNFGPQYFRASSDWEALFVDLDAQPLFFTLDNRLAPVAAGAFPWPPMWASVNGVLSQDALNNYLSNFYSRADAWDYLVAGAFPAFHDIYEEAGVRDGYGYLDSRDGATFEHTLQTALDQNPEIVQIITWNDYGEGTIIEPTLEFGLRYLERIQDFRRTTGDDFIYSLDDLDLPHKFYTLRRRHQEEAEIFELLDEVFDMIVFGEIEEARTVIDSLYALSSMDSEANTRPVHHGLRQNYPNPFNPDTEVVYRITKPAKVRLEVFNCNGQQVATLVDDIQRAGVHRTRFQGHPHSAGIYVYRLSTPDFTETRKMVLLP